MRGFIELIGIEDERRFQIAAMMIIWDRKKPISYSNADSRAAAAAVISRTTTRSTNLR